MKILPVRADLFHADRQTSRSLQSLFRNFAKAPKSDTWASPMDDKFKAELLHVICRTGSKTERSILTKLLYVGGRWGGGFVCWGFGWWAEPGGERGLVQCYGADQYGKTQTLAVLFTTLTNTLSGQNTHTHTHTQCATEDKLLNHGSFSLSKNKGKKSLLANHHEIKS
jgi:hypothetical protein